MAVISKSSLNYLLSVIFGAVSISDAHAAGGHRPDPAVIAAQARAQEAIRTAQAHQAEVARLRAQLAQEQLAREVRDLQDARAREAAAVAAAQQQENLNRQQAENSALLAQMQTVTDNFTWSRARCTAANDGAVDSAEAADVRRNWAISCFNQLSKDQSLPEMTRMRYTSFLGIISANTIYNQDRHFYPTFGEVEFHETSRSPRTYEVVMRPHGAITAQEMSSCDVLRNLVPIGVCVSGCFTPDQRVFMQSGYTPILTAYNQRLMSVLSLDRSSTSTDLKYVPRELDYYTVSPQDEINTIYVFTTAGGSRLQVTGNHGVVLSDGTLKVASEIRTGNELMTASGSADLVLNVETQQHRGKVYNMRLKSEDPVENLVVAEGLLVGSSFHQNEGVSYINRMILRDLVVSGND